MRIGICSHLIGIVAATAGALDSIPKENRKRTPYAALFKSHIGAARILCSNPERHQDIKRAHPDRIAHAVAGPTATDQPAARTDAAGAAAASLRGARWAPDLGKTRR